MRQRLYFLLPSVERAKDVFQQLLLARIEANHIHFIAKDGTALTDLPEASVLQKSDAIHGAAIGLLAGTLTGAAAGLIAMLYPPRGLAMGLGIVLAMSMLGAVMGVWVSGMIGADTPSTHLDAFRADIERGKVLMMLDVPRTQADDISRAIRERHPEAESRGFDATIPAPFP
jgi:hypothetical protein